MGFTLVQISFLTCGSCCAFSESTPSSPLLKQSKQATNGIRTHNLSPTKRVLYQRQRVKKKHLRQILEKKTFKVSKKVIVSKENNNCKGAKNTATKLSTNSSCSIFLKWLREALITLFVRTNKMKKSVGVRQKKEAQKNGKVFSSNLKKGQTRLWLLGKKKNKRIMRITPKVKFI